eukprot:11170244-Lingulodinium_polyedra.AAC.1
MRSVENAAREHLLCAARSHEGPGPGGPDVHPARGLKPAAAGGPSAGIPCWPAAAPSPACVTVGPGLAGLREA